VRPVLLDLGPGELAGMQEPIASVPVRTRPIRGVDPSLLLPYVTPSLKVRAMDTKGAHGRIDHSPGPSPPPWPPCSPTALRMSMSPGPRLMMSKLSTYFSGRPASMRLPLTSMTCRSVAVPIASGSILLFATFLGMYRFG
jgi:hypothetical protein